MRSCWVAALMIMSLYACSAARAAPCSTESRLDGSGESQCKVESSPSPLTISNYSDPMMSAWVAIKWQEKDGKNYYGLLPNFNRTYVDADFTAARARSFSEFKYKLKQLPDGKPVMRYDPKNIKIHAPGFSLGKAVYFSRFEIKEIGDLLKKKKIDFNN